MVHLASIIRGGTELADIEKRCLRVYEEHGVGEVIWLLTGSCNLRCIHCYVEAPSVYNELTTTETLKIARELAELGVPVVFLSGGEPLMRRDLFEILSTLNECNILTVLSCNGQLLGRDIVRRLRRCGVWFIAVPIYGPPWLHDHLTGTDGSFKRVIEAIKACISEGVNVCVKTLVTSHSYVYIPRLLETCLDMGVKAFYVCDLINTGRAKSLRSDRIPPARWRKLVDYLVELTRKFKVEVDIGAMPSAAPYLIKRLGDSKMPLPSCPAGRGLIAITPSGKVVPCNFLLEVEIGDLRSTSLKEIIRSSGVLKRLRSPRGFKGPCGECRFSELCGGCRAKAYFSGDLEGSDPTCLLRAEKKRV